MKRSIVIIVICFLINAYGFSQVYPLLPKYYLPLDSTVLVNNNDLDEEILLQRHKKVSYSVTLGTGYSTFGNDMSMVNSYIAPSFSYWATPRLNISVAGIFSQNNMSGMEGYFGIEPGYTVNSNMSNYGIAGSAYYQLSKKWSIWGDGMYLEDQTVFNNYESELYNTDFKTASVGVAYKASEKFQFHLQFRYADGLNPAYNLSSPFYSPGFSPFNSNNGIWGY